MSTRVATTWPTASGKAAGMFPFRPMSRLTDVSLSIPRFISLKMVERSRSALRQRSVVAIVRVVAVIHVAIETMRSVEPWSGSVESATDEPVGTVVAIGGAIVRRIVEVAIGTDRLDPDTD